MNEMGKAETRISERWLHNFNLVREGKVEESKEGTVPLGWSCTCN